jgi:deoxycytidylate deaminase
MKKITLVVIRKSLDSRTNNKFTESKPCKNCLTMLKKYGVKKIEYTTFEGKIEKCKVNKLFTNHQSMVFNQLKEEKILKKGCRK